MCGRYVRRSPLQHVIDLFSAAPIPKNLSLSPSFNVAPTQSVPVIRVGADGQRTVSILRWGLVPSWAGDPSIGNRMINARAETLSEKPAFKKALQSRRCIIPADGFYEWQKTGKAKQPYFIHRPDHAQIGFAGLWETWTDGEHTIESCTIITTQANDVVRPIHERMPLILAPADYDRWLDPHSTPDQFLPLLRTTDAVGLLATPVSTRVNSPGNDDPGCIEGT
jgi:putative SOS response-associated peptidase YedK